MVPRSEFYLAHGVALWGLLLISLLSFGGGSQAVGPCRESGGKTFCHIARPVVDRHLSEYRQIKFKDRDLITIRADGCIQTGGRGRTCKKYVDPSGPNSEQFYHGLIWVPGGTAGLERIQAYKDKKIFVRTCGLIKPENLFLRLGYEDDEYGDNGYDCGDDEGTDHQCRGSGEAFIDLEIEHNATQPAEDAPAPLDLERPKDCENNDRNLLPLNPRWGWQRTNPPLLPDPVQQCTALPKQFEDPNCSTQHPAFDLPTGTNGVICATEQQNCIGLAAGVPCQFASGDARRRIHGHVNYFPAVYTGTIKWDTHTGGLFGDDDYNFNLTPDRSAGLTVHNDHAIGIEFDSDETIDHFDTPWWNSFHQAVDLSDEIAGRLVNFSEHAIVAGVPGLDCEHDCRSEIHPVFAFAVLVRRVTFPTQPLSEEDTWAIFVRDAGNEGFCSSQIHRMYFLDDTFKFLLPRPSGASDYSVLGTTVFKSNDPNSAYSVESGSPSGVPVSFLLPENPSPFVSTMIHGELHLKWTFSSTTGQAPSKPTPVTGRLSSTETPKVEENLAALSRNLTNDQLDFYRSKTRTKAIKHNFNVPMVGDLAPLVARLKRAGLAGRKQEGGASLHDSQKEARDRKKFDVATKVLWRTYSPNKVSRKPRKRVKR